MRITCESGKGQCVASLAVPNAGCQLPRGTYAGPLIQSDQPRQARYAAATTHLIHTDYTSPEDLNIYVDGFLKDQDVAAVLIGERLSALGFAGATALLADTLESRHYRFHAKEDDAGPVVRCPSCDGPMPPP